MNPEEWQQIKGLFQTALDLDAAERSAFLDNACAAHPGLRSEIESLLAEHDSGGNFMEKPVFEAAAELFESEPGSSLIGRQLGPYSITGILGRSLGVVYLAEDSRLHRLVALKALAPESMQDNQHRQRLRREAQAAARLTHPGIATVHALEEFEGNNYIVYEYVRGTNLADKCLNAPMELSLLLDLGVQIAEALAFAHEKGIIHRDLKPQNIMLTEDGKTKILDFGLARIQNPAEESDLAANLTVTGSFIGTPAYSSPEQLLAAPIDFRTDIFSFGILFYEMASGVHPFAAPDGFSTIARILEAEVTGLTEINPSIPPQLDKIIHRCLRRDPDRRYGSTRDLLADLEHLRRELALSPAASSGHSEPVRIADSPSPGRSNPLWWWQFHQACVGCIYYLLLYPLWRAKEWTPGGFGSLFFYLSLVAVGIAANLRFHLWFTSSSYPGELPFQRRRAHTWIRAADILFVLLLFLGATAIFASHAVVTTIIVTGAIGCLVAFTLIEPTTVRAAFKTDRGKDSPAA